MFKLIFIAAGVVVVGAAAYFINSTDVSQELEAAGVTADAEETKAE